MANKCHMSDTVTTATAGEGKDEQSPQPGVDENVEEQNHDRHREDDSHNGSDRDAWDWFHG